MGDAKLKAALAAGVFVIGVAGGTYKYLSEWLKTENGEREMREKYSVAVLKYEAIRRQIIQANQIGHGSFGIVYRCIIPELGNQSHFAAKVLDRSKQLKVSQEECLGKKEFYRELEVLAICRHPNIIRTVAVSFDFELVLIYPFVSGGNLEEKLSGGAQLPCIERGSIALQLLDAIIYLHMPLDDKPCILHRDIKPQNVLLEASTPGGRVMARLTDFGSACIYDEERARAEDGNGFSVRFVGTRGYADPTGVHQTLDERSDAYSLGVVILRLLTGRPALDAQRRPLPAALRRERAADGQLTYSAMADPAAGPAGAGGWADLAEAMGAVGAGLAAEDRADRLAPAEARAQLLRVGGPAAAAEAAAEEAAASEERRLCGVCLVAPRAARFQPCGHLMACVPCAHSVRRQMGSCCICRRGIDALLAAAPNEPTFSAQLGGPHVIQPLEIGH